MVGFWLARLIIGKYEKAKLKSLYYKLFHSDNKITNSRKVKISERRFIEAINTWPQTEKSIRIIKEIKQLVEGKKQAKGFQPQKLTREKQIKRKKNRDDRTNQIIHPGKDGTREIDTPIASTKSQNHKIKSKRLNYDKPSKKKY